MELFSLFFVFMKIGFTSFGGMSMVPVINEEMIMHGWMTSEDVSNILAIAEMTPGPLGINCATFAGIQVAGVLGGIIAVIGVLTPAFTTTMLAAIFYEKFKKTSLLSSILYVIRPVCIGLIFAVIYSLSITNYISTDILSSILNICIGVTAFVMILKFKKSVPVVICTSAIIGLVGNILVAMF